MVHGIKDILMHGVDHQIVGLTQLIQLVPKMREMDSDFGILPYFKYDEAQQNYYTTIGSWHSVFLGVPTGPQDLERTGIITEVLASESYDLTEAYYDKTLKGKTTRDEESSASLDVIINSISVRPFAIFSFDWNRRGWILPLT